MGKRSSLAVLPRFHPNSGAGGSAWHCAGAISTTTGQCIATCVAKIEFWLDPAATVWLAMQRMQTAMDSLNHGQQWPADELTGM
jgi:hypothetical protein